MDSFLQPFLTPIVGMPTYDTLVERIYQISYNADLMHITLGGGKLGFISLAVSPAVYTTLSITLFKNFLNSVPYPTILPNDTSIKQTAI